MTNIFNVLLSTNFLYFLCVFIMSHCLVLFAGVMKFSQLADASSLPRVQTIQNSYSLLVRVPYETDLAEVCSESNCNVSLLAYSPLAGGSLTGKYITSDGVAPEGCRFTLFPGYMERFNQSKVREAVEKYMEVAKKHEMRYRII